MTDHATVLAERFEEMVRGYARLVRSVVVQVGGPAAARLGDDVEQASLSGNLEADLR